MMGLAEYKTALRISHDKLNNDIQSNIEACKKDMERVGITGMDDTDPLIHKAIELFLKWQYNFMAEGEKYERAYKEMRDGLSLCGDYNDRQEKSCSK
ncbi:MAG: hypothetical protein MR278_09425 [Bacteroidales bacterium]|nr:DNA-packaging protein [Anaerotignum sp.]MCI5680173.1 hypothetical protein [Bacteroidales bacterium]MDY3926863.1 DNA-packaging protein [Anaerotignum sp.]